MEINKQEQQKMNETAIERRLTAVEKQAEYNAREIEELKPVVKEINTMSKTMVQLVEQSKQTNENVKELKTKVDGIEKEPAENMKWLRRTILTSTITTILGAVLGALVALVIK